MSHLFRRWPRLVAPIAKQSTFHHVAFARTLQRTLERGGFVRIEITNSRPSRGDPYRTLRRGDTPSVQSAKWSWITNLKARFRHAARFGAQGSGQEVAG